MNYRLSENFKNLKPSAIREILKHTSGTDVIPFAAGNPSVEAFPVEDIRRIINEITKRPPATYLQYGISEGYTPLRDYLKADLTAKGLKSDSDDLMIVSGAQQGIDLSAQIFCDPGDVILCEDPSFIGSLNAFRSHGIKLVGIPMEDDGVDLAALETSMQKNPTAKLLYLIPNFQNPSGLSTSWEKRRKIYELAKKYGIIILEDNPYGDLRFAGEDIPSIKSLDREGLVIYCGSFSKLIAPGIRVGFVLANSDLISKLTVAKQASDVHTNLLAQILVHDFITGCDLSAHTKKMQALYRHKYTLMAHGLEENVPDSIKFTKPEGGLFVLGYLPERMDMMGVVKACIERKLAIVPGSAFSVDLEKPAHTIRLNFSTPSDEQITRGCEILGAVIKTI
ncbi:MAG TPA: PLP-dependent aminotransferase family protein [Oscillospiraceae bacterium]|nr:PLP-dependent aminotransferase family protein [Oscillospiraceae bacterium]HPF56588.1 PLP-dependent aminotransferase family protein [Clostridiales bacterium]HPK36496.1 PLP-dependent aminotransferase family protein [Oscillospiraceae bacterium]HPR76444.1 PLP-dependent aminotransferase family protein [Oscillospiraceae bacterium]